MRRKEKEARRRLHYPLFPGSGRIITRGGGRTRWSYGKWCEWKEAPLSGKIPGERREGRRRARGDRCWVSTGVSRDSWISCFVADALPTKRWSGSSSPSEAPIRKRFVVVRTCFVKRTLRLPISGRHSPTRVPSGNFMGPHDKVRTSALILRHVGRTGTP